jgi:hypothetical protein
MKRLLTATILLLWSSWALAQSGTPTTTNDGSQNPGNSSPSTQQPDKSQKTKSHHGQTVKGCLSGAADTFVLTDASGKTYELLGATRELQANVGHKVQLWGNKSSSGGGERTTAKGPQAIFGVKEVKSLSERCK